MSEEEQRIAIAEACGWSHVKRWIDGDPSGWPPSDEMRREAIESGCDPCIPDYLADLNAMHEAEKQMTDVEAFGFNEQLEVILADTESTCGAMDFYWHATAAQRAEAFCRVKYPERFKP